MTDPYELDRFLQAQAPVIGTALAELGAGRKRSHWMWFVFPQLEGLGRSAMAARYAIGSLAEARAYLTHPVLGPRLVQASELVLAVPQRTAHDIFGSPDDLKFHSSLTLFDRAASGQDVFRHCLERFFGGQPDPQTLGLL
jgi:uncharacterized protein (DUF1810 family)